MRQPVFMAIWFVVMFIAMNAIYFAGHKEEAIWLGVSVATSAWCGYAIGRAWVTRKRPS